MDEHLTGIFFAENKVLTGINVHVGIFSRESFARRRKVIGLPAGFRHEKGDPVRKGLPNNARREKPQPVTVFFLALKIIASVFAAASGFRDSSRWPNDVCEYSGKREREGRPALLLSVASRQLSIRPILRESLFGTCSIRRMPFRVQEGVE